jgi:hypothetical protein
MYTDRRPGVTIDATVTLLDSVKGKRTSRDGLRWRPNHNFGAPDGRAFYIGQVEFHSGEHIQPGESREALVRFIDGPGLREHLWLGRIWRIQEGPNLVSTATVARIHDET